MAPQANRPTDSEIEILGVLWEHGPCTVRQVHDHLNRSRKTGYTTVLKLMQIMFEKRILTRDERQRSHVYRPKQREESTQKKLVSDLVSRAFGGSTEKLVLRALSAKKATPKQIEQIRRMLDDIEGETK